MKKKKLILLSVNRNSIFPRYLVLEPLVISNSSRRAEVGETFHLADVIQCVYGLKKGGRQGGRRGEW